MERDLAIVIEDETALAIMYERILSRVGYRVLMASEGTGGLDLLQAYTPRLIMMDMLLPNINGKDLIDYVVRQPRLKETFILVASSAKEYASALDSVQNGQFFIKPILPRQVMEIAERLFED
ncbi:response regulator [Phototrophicus methaneseepsis]|uniref:Response regulator n=1 Tax=Phototrophicus methaneseepsis TaxID=2710758 RepID=A0A7S8EA64_9CHLR|nr:response regulator [Phototrophicus methaneseepsis]QPC83211.1 response regulator [Phototrophicus methaneseepsis]